MGDLAIDDVSVIKGSCHGQATPPSSLLTVLPGTEKFPFYQSMRANNFYGEQVK